MYVDDSTRLRHMLDAAGKVQEMAAGHSRHDLDVDEGLAVVLAHWVRIIGEAARLISPELKQQPPEVAWREIQGMRHRIVHDYTETSLDILWDAVSRDVPTLVPQLEAVLAGTGKDPGA